MNFSDPSRLSSLVIEPVAFASDECTSTACQGACSCDSDNMCKCHDLESPKAVVEKHYAV